MNKSHYIISGVAPGVGGVGRLMRMLLPLAKNSGYDVIYRRNNLSLREMLNEFRYLALLKEMYLRFLDNLLFLFKVFLITDSKVLLIHPQTVGYKLVFRLLKKNTIALYVMDNSFFCIRSYNSSPVSKKECLLCLGDLDSVLNECHPFPIKISKKKNIEHLKKFRRLSKNIFFVAQNENQKKLLIEHFGQDVNCRVIGMCTGELMNLDSESVVCHDKKNYILLHAAPSYEKGLDYFLLLARKMKDYQFVVPSRKDLVARKVGSINIPENVFFEDCTWESGLKELILSARMVINPSMWSAPIEGAFIKSLALNSNVAVVETRYGFEREVSIRTGHLRLSENSDFAVIQIRNYLSRKIYSNSIESRISFIEEQRDPNSILRFLKDFKDSKDYQCVRG